MISHIAHITLMVLVGVLVAVRLTQLHLLGRIVMSNVAAKETTPAKDVRGSFDLGVVVLVTMLVALALGALGILVYCHAMATASVWALACVGTGFLTGFLFGFPKVSQGKPWSMRTGNPLPTSRIPFK